jgi:hypothetical protein
MARIHKNVSLCPETHAIAQEMEDFSAFVRRVLTDQHHKEAVQRLEEAQAILEARTRAFRQFEDHITRAYNNRDMTEVKKALVGRGLI